MVTGLSCTECHPMINYNKRHFIIRWHWPKLLCPCLSQLMLHGDESSVSSFLSNFALLQRMSKTSLPNSLLFRTKSIHLTQGSQLIIQCIKDRYGVMHELRREHRPSTKMKIPFNTCDPFNINHSNRWHQNKGSGTVLVPIFHDKTNWLSVELLNHWKGNRGLCSQSKRLFKNKNYAVKSFTL